MDLLGGIAELLDNSLIGHETGIDDEPRYGMLETIREFGLEQLTANGEAEETRDRQAAWALAEAERSWQNLYRRPLRGAELDRIGREHDNMRAALGWFAERGDAERCLRLATALSPFLYFRSYRLEGMDWLERGQALAGDRAVADQAARLGAP